jgi:hypothetical protein
LRKASKSWPVLVEHSKLVICQIAKTKINNIL